MSHDLKPKPGAFRMDARVYYADTDAAGIVYHANYLAFMERARAEWLRSVGFESVKLARTLGIGFLVRSVKLDYLAPALLDDLITITAEVTEFGRSRVHVSQYVMRGDTVLVHGQVNVVCVDIKAGKSTELPADIRHALEIPA